ncbi:DUF6585 family protein [Kitasatospora sp. NPDC051914]|uniref:DUF6585 family protein n=1 Tax=Kitasatospora sp. NPDC051914 TaxID=3154945 RepID=UPI003439FC01
MTGQDSRTDDQGRLPTAVDEAAARAGLGARRAVYPGAQSQSGSVGCAAAAVLVLGGIALALSLTAGTAMAVLPLGLLVLCLIGIPLERSTARKNSGVRLDLYDRGLTAVVKGRIHAARYESTSVLQNTVRHTGVGGYTSYEYTLTDVAGGKVVLRGRADGVGEVAEPGRFTDPREWGPAVQDAVTRARLPAAIAALASDGRHEVGSARESARWQEIQEIKVFDGVIRLKVAGRWRALTSAAVSTTPNVFVFLALAERLREHAHGPTA